MSGRRRLIISLLGALAIVGGANSAAYAQDAQVEGASKVAREKAAAQRIENTTPPAKNAAPAETTATPKPEGLKRRAGEQVAGNPRGKTVIFGMHVQEADNGRVKVVEVGAATPAYDAGIREGDELVLFQDFQANTYRKWIDGISKVAAAAPDGSELKLVVLRNGKRVATQIHVPENHLTALQFPIGPPPQGQPLPPDQQANVGIMVNDGGNDVLINNVGPFGNFFSGEASNASERAMAQLVRVGSKQPTAEPSVTQDVSRTGEVGANWTSKQLSAKDGARIGLAGFRDDPNGMLVMVDVGSLEPGNYVVGISDPSVIGQQPASVAVPPTTVPQPPPVEGAPASVPATQPGTTIPPTGQVRPSTIPPTGQVNPSSATPTGQSAANIALTEQINQANAAKTGAGSAGVPMLNEIGTLTVDQSGTGRMQHVVDGVQVRNVVGQALVIYTQVTGQQNTLPPNLDPTADPGAGKAPGQRGAAQRASAGSPLAVASNASSNGMPVPVAAGVIRLISDHRPPVVAQPPSSASAAPPATVR